MTRASISEQYRREPGSWVRELRSGPRVWPTTIEDRADADLEGSSAWWQSFLRGGRVRPPEASVSPIRTIDAFCGCGGLTLGVREAALAVGRPLESVAAIDVDEGALELHRANFGTGDLIHSNAASLVDFHVRGSGEASRFAYPPELDASIASRAGGVDLFLAGPPCQGHSNLNNRTRREDPRNHLYLTAIALAVALEAPMVLIENVPDVINDRDDVVSAARALLKASGYRFVDSGFLAADELGWAQTRKRFFLLAAKAVSRGRPTLKSVAAGLNSREQAVSWAIGDLLGRVGDSGGGGVMNSVPRLSEENRDRIAWLFDHEEHDLDDRERPDCHKDGHTYKSVYGRMHWDKPSQTITTGFLTPGRGRYIHSKEQRVLTPHEAARIQGFPDGFRFVVNGHDPARTAIAKWIGDAVPSILGYAAALPLLTAG